MQRMLFALEDGMMEVYNEHIKINKRIIKDTAIFMDRLIGGYSGVILLYAG